MRYSRVLAVLALIGVVGLTAALVSHGGRPAPNPVRATVTAPTLRRALQQQLQALVTTHWPTRPHAPAIAVPSGGGTTCPVASGGCTTNPCVVFVQGGSPVPVPQGLAVPGGPAAQRCARRALPRTFPVSSPVVQAQSVSVSSPQPRSRHGS